MFVEHCNKNNINVLFLVQVADQSENSEHILIWNSKSNFKTKVRKFELRITSLNLSTSLHVILYCIMITDKAAVGHILITRLATWNLSFRRCRWSAAAQAILSTGNRRWYSGQCSDRGAPVSVEARLLVFCPSPRKVCRHCGPWGDNDLHVTVPVSYTHLTLPTKRIV